jgi:hypothetical protein
MDILHKFALKIFWKYQFELSTFIFFVLALHSQDSSGGRRTLGSNHVYSTFRTLAKQRFVSSHTYKVAYLLKDKI